MQHFHSEPEAQSTYPASNCGPTAAQLPPLEAEEQRRVQESIEDYLDRVCRPLVDSLPYAARQELRHEIAQHLHALVQAYHESGYAPALATEKALDKFGPPELVAQKWNPVAARRGQVRRMERWLAGQWQGMAATLALCLVAGFLGLMQSASVQNAQRDLASHPRSTVSAPTLPGYHRRYPLTEMIIAQMETGPLDVEMELNKARADCIAAQARLSERRELLHNLEMSVAQAWADVASSGNSLPMRRKAQLQQLTLDRQRGQVEEAVWAVEERQQVVDYITTKREQRIQGGESH